MLANIICVTESVTTVGTNKKVKKAFTPSHFSGAVGVKSRYRILGRFFEAIIRFGRLIAEKEGSAHGFGGLCVAR
jgi:hypothetical protein